MNCACGKAAYGSQREARDIVRRIRTAEGRFLRPYRCPTDARLWHLTSQGKARR